jgi:hypothetical protein
MQHLWTFLVLIAAAINLAPVLGALAPRTLGYAVGFSSMLSFLLIAWLVGGYSAEIRRVVLVDVAGIGALAGAGLVHAFWLRTAAA